MKILMVGWGAEPDVSGGMDVHTSRIAGNLALSGNCVRLLVPSFSETGSSEARVEKIDAGEKPGNLAKVMSCVKEYNRNIFSFAGSLGFDIIHTHDWLGAEAGFRIRRKLEKKWVHTVHSLEYMRSCRQGTGESRIEMLEELAIRSADRLITVSRFMQKEIEKKYGRCANVIYNAPSVSAEGARRKVPREPQRIFFAGRLAEQKGLKYLIYSARDVLKQFPSAKFILAGEGNLRGSLEEFSKSLGTGESVQFPGFIGREELVDEYQRAALFVSPSVFEPFGITILDAAVLGAPIVATRNTGAIELFAKDSAAVVKAEDVKELSGKIISLMKDEKKRAGMAKAAREDAGRMKGWAELSKELERIYSS